MKHFFFSIMAVGLLFFGLLAFHPSTTNEVQPLEFCIAEEPIVSEEANMPIWISPTDTTMLFPEFGIRKKDLFVKNRDTLTSYYIHPDLVRVIGEVFRICEAYQAKTKRRYHIRFNSVVRSKHYNRKIGGVSNSEHLEPIGHAIDIRFAEGSKTRHFVRHFHRAILKKDADFQGLFDAGCRSFGFYSWGMHFGVRERPKAWRKHQGQGYSIWDKRGSN